MRRWLRALRERRALARQLRARRRALRAELARRRQALPRRRRWPWALLALLLLLLLLLRDCRCAEPAPPPVAEVAPPAGTAEAVETPPAPVTRRIPTRRRPDYRVAPGEPVPWLASFRMQVAARGPRLAECFVGAERPGSLRWTAAVEPELGRVSDQAIEPTQQSDGLDRQQRACVFEVLAQPPYQLDPAEGPATPTRIGMVIEF